MWRLLWINEKEIWTLFDDVRLWHFGNTEDFEEVVRSEKLEMENVGH